MLTTRVDIDPLSLFQTFDFAPRRALVAAVSGGSDSLALLLLAKAWLDRTAPGIRLVAVTVDHDLRPGSAEEARQVARIAARHGISHRTMSWAGPKPATGIPAAARLARYRLLAEAARREGTDIILTGHTADDQAETVLMRAERADGRQDARGLAGMAPATLFEGESWIVRPLLGTRRRALRDFLRGRGETWLDDPTNANPAFERPRMRAMLGQGNDRRVEAALAEAANAARARRQLGEQAADLIRAFATCPCPGLIRLDPRFAQAEPGAGVYALRVLLGTSGGAPHLPDLPRAQAVFARMARERFCATLSRTVIDARKQGIFLHREARHLPAPQAPAEGMLWDGRFRLETSGDAQDLTVAPAGSEMAKTPEIEAVDAPAGLVRAACATLPALWRGGEWLGPLPAAHGPRGVSAMPVAGPWALFLPGFDLAAAMATAELIGAKSPPLPPLAGHIASKA